MNSSFPRQDDAANAMDTESTHAADTGRSTHIQASSVWQPNPVPSYLQTTIPGLTVNARQFVPVSASHNTMDNAMDAELPPGETATEPMNVEYWEEQMEDPPSAVESPKTPPQRASHTLSRSMDISPPDQKTNHSWRSPSKLQAALADSDSDEEDDIVVSKKALPSEPLSPTLNLARQRVSMNLASTLASLKVSPASDAQRPHAKSDTAAARSTSLNSSSQLPTARAEGQSLAWDVNGSSANAERPTMPESHASFANSTSLVSAVQTPPSNSAVLFTQTSSPTSSNTTTTMPAKTPGSRRDRKEKKLEEKKVGEKEKEEKEEKKKEGEGEGEESRAVAAAPPAKPAEGAGLSREGLAGHAQRRPVCIQKVERGDGCLPGIVNYREWSRVQHHQLSKTLGHKPSPAELEEHCVAIIESRWKEYDSMMGKGPFSWTNRDPLEGQQWLTSRRGDESEEVDVLQAASNAGRFDASRKELNDAIARHEANLDANTANDPTKLRAYVKELTQRYDMDDDKLIKLRAELRDAKEEALRNSNHITYLEGKQATADKELAAQNKDNSKRVKAGDVNEKYIADLESKFKKLQEDHEELNTKQKTTSKALTAAQSEIVNAKTQKNDALQQLKTSKDGLNLRVGEIYSLKEAVKVLKAQAGNHDNLKDQLKTAKQAASENADLYEGYTTRLRELLGASETDELKPIEDVITELEAAYQDRLWNDNDVIHGQTLDQELEDSSSVKESVDIAELDKKLQEVTKQLDSKTLELSELQADNVSRDAAKDQRISNLEADLQITKAELVTREKARESMVEIHSSQLTESTQKLEAAKNELSELKKEHAVVDEKQALALSKIKEDLVSMTQQRDDKTALLNKHDVDSKKEQEKLNMMELALAQEKKRTIALESGLKNATDQANAAKSKLEEADKTHKANQKILADNNATTLKEWKAKEIELETTTKRSNDELKQERDQRRSQQETYETKLSDSKIELQSKVNKHNSTIETLKIDHATELERRSKEATKKQDDTTGKLKETESEFAKATEDYATALKAYENELQDLKDQVKRLIAENKNLNDDLVEAFDTSSKHDNNAKILQSRLNLAESKLEAEAINHESELLKAQEDLELVNSKLEITTNELDAARQAQTESAKNATADKSSGCDLPINAADEQLILPPQALKTSHSLDLSYLWVMLLLLFAIPCLKLGINLWTSSQHQCDLSSCWIQNIPPLDYVQSWLDVDSMMYG